MQAKLAKGAQPIAVFAIRLPLRLNQLPPPFAYIMAAESAQSRAELPAST